MLRIGIVGCGRILNAHLQGYKALVEAGVTDFRITALVARRAEDAHSFVRRGSGPPPRPPVSPPGSGDPLAAPHTYLSDFQPVDDVRVYTDYRAMLDDDVVDAVNDFTTVALHHQVAAACLAAGKHLLTQKPLAISVAAAQAMLAQAAQAGVNLSVFENVRNAESTRAAGWAVQSGRIGTPQMALVGSLGGLWSPDRVVADTPWRHRKLEAGGGGSIDIGVHLFHLLRYVMGEVRWVSATTRIFEPLRRRRDAAGTVIEEVRADVDDTFFATVGFDHDAIGQLLWSWAGRGPALNLSGAPAFFGSAGCIQGGQLYDAQGRAAPLVALYRREAGADLLARHFPLGLTDTFALQQYDWLQAIAAGRAAETSGAEGLRDLACAFAVPESAALGCAVTVDDVLSGAIAGYQAAINAAYGL